MLHASRWRDKGYTLGAKNEERWTGVWWLPMDDSEEVPEDTVSGVLTVYPNGGIILELEGTLTPSRHNNMELYLYERVLGIPRNGGRITLLECRAYSRNRPFFGYIAETCDVKHALIGHHSFTNDQAKFDKSYIKYTELDNWVFRQKSELPKKVDSGYLVEHEDLDPIKVDYGAANIELQRRARLKNDESGHCSIVSHNSFFEINSKNKIIVDDWIKNYVIPIQHFMTIATNYANSSTEFYFEVPPGVPDGIPKEIRILSKMETPQFPQSRSRYFIDDFMFMLRDLNDPSAIIYNWFSVYDKIYDAIDLLNSAFPGIQPFGKIRFLNTAQAAETFHRIMYDKPIIDKSEHKKKIEQIIESAPSLHRKWLKSNLSHSNTMSLSNRIRDLIDRSDHETKSVIGDIDKFICVVRDSRNFYTHYDKRKKKHIAHGHKLDLVSLVLSLVIRSNIMIEIGIDKYHVGQLVLRNKLSHSIGKNWLDD